MPLRVLVCRAGLGWFRDLRIGGGGMCVSFSSSSSFFFFLGGGGVLKVKGL